MSKLNKLLGVVCINLKPFIRNPLWSVILLLQPLGMMIIFRIIGGSGSEVHAIIGGIVVFSINGGMVNLPQYVVRDKAIKFNYFFVSSPISPLAYSFGKAIGISLPLVPPLLLMIILLRSFQPFGWIGFLSLIGVVSLSWVAGVLMGFFISTYINNMIYISAVANGLQVVLAMLPPVYYPVSLLPSAIQAPVLLIPTSSMAHLSRVAVGAESFSRTTTLLSFVILAAYCLFFSLLIVRKSQWVEK
ncbi:MAG: ABC transporter permease [Candidatus Thermoplasmatota archaeon]|nr:ABC transporter permease [Candidatus Thermoplasmatota archaeon]